MPKRVDAGAVLAAVGATLLVVSIFLDWFKPDITGWEVFEVVDLILAALSLAALAAVADRLDWSDLVPGRVLPLLGAVATVLVVTALLNHPPAALGQEPDEGAWLALAGALTLLVGALLSLARISFAVSFDERDRLRTGAGGGAAPGQPTTPAPPSTRSTPGAPTGPRDPGATPTAETPQRPQP